MQVHFIARDDTASIYTLFILPVQETRLPRYHSAQTLGDNRIAFTAFHYASILMAASLPPDLRVLCRKLTSIPPAQLPHALPSLINHVLHCKEPLSAPQERKVKDSSAEGAQLVDKLKASITTHLNGRSREARFTAIGLIKAVVDVGGWEVLQGCKPWVGGLLSIVEVR